MILELSILNLHEMHTQFKNVTIDGRKVMYYFGCSNFKPVRNGKQISPTAKNKWPKDWPKFWFYHKVPFVEEKRRTKNGEKISFGCEDE